MCIVHCASCVHLWNSRNFLKGGQCPLDIGQVTWWRTWCLHLDRDRAAVITMSPGRGELAATKVEWFDKLELLPLNHYCKRKVTSVFFPALLNITRELRSSKITICFLLLNLTNCMPYICFTCTLGHFSCLDHMYWCNPANFLGQESNHQNQGNWQWTIKSKYCGPFLFPTGCSDQAGYLPLTTT